MKEIIEKIKTFIKAKCDKVVADIKTIAKKLITIIKENECNLILGMIVSMFFGITLGMDESCFVPVVFVAFIREFISNWKHGESNITRVVITIVGGLIVAFFFAI